MTADIDAFRDDVIGVILSTITSYIITWLPKSHNLKELVDLLHHPLKGILSTQLGRFEQCGDEVLKSLTDCWHAFAKVSVYDHGTITSVWEDVMPGSCLMIHGTKDNTKSTS